MADCSSASDSPRLGSGSRWLSLGRFSLKRFFARDEPDDELAGRLFLPLPLLFTPDASKGARASACVERTAAPSSRVFGGRCISPILCNGVVLSLHRFPQRAGVL